ncbi:MAG: hypothetical protein IKM43_00040 [Clostridia bacterium]|nr:hypothetical protein [Clostridia bacterium]
MVKFDSVRIFEKDMPVRFGFQTKNRIEFVVSKSKLQQFKAKMFGDIYNVGTSRAHDGLMVYRPQSYKDFLLFLQSVNIENKDISVYKMEKLANQPTYDTKLIENGLERLMNFAKKYYLDTYLSEEEKENAQKLFVKKCYKILAEKGLYVDKGNSI